jgi:hypothetical protein
MTPQKNARCWCGSGRKQKHCHRQSDDSPRNEAHLRQLFRASLSIRTCHHPEASASTCGKIIDAHTLQRARVLGAIVDTTRHVLTLNPLRGRPTGDACGSRRVSWNEASTFTGFCTAHDGRLFAPLETTPFIATPEQCFLHAYRSICRELHAKNSVLKFSPTLASWVAPGDTAGFEEVALGDVGVQLGLGDMQRAKALLDQALFLKEFARLDFAVFEFAGELSIAANGAFFPELTLDGDELQVLDSPHVAAEWIAVSTDVTPDGGALIFCWPREQYASRAFVDGVIELNSRRRMQVLAQFLFLHFENTYFSQRWWNGLLPDLQTHFQRIYGLQVDYTEDTLVRRRVVQWKERAVRRSGSAPPGRG